MKTKMTATETITLHPSTKESLVDLARIVVAAFWEGEAAKDPDAYYDKMVHLSNKLDEEDKEGLR